MNEHAPLAPRSAADALRRSNLGDLRDDEVASVLGDPRQRVLTDGEVLVSQNAEADAAYVVLEGELRVLLEPSVAAPPAPASASSDGHEVAVLGPGDLVGEISHLVGGRRDATVVARGPAAVLVLGPRALDELLDRDPELAARLAAQARQRLREAQLARHVLALFGDVGSAVVEHVGEVVEWVVLRAGEHLSDQGDEPDGAYLVASGRLRAVFTEEDEEDAHVVGEIGRGELVSEMALLGTEGRRSASVIAARDTDLARFPPASFAELPETEPGATLAVARTVLARSAVRARGRRPATGRTGAADPTDASPGSIRLGEWLHEVETRHAFVVYDVGDAWSPWSARAVRQADQVMLDADADADGDHRPGRMERRTERTLSGTRFPRRVLALHHPADRDRPSGTARWFESRTVDLHVHLREGSDADAGRQARLLAGRALGLVLGGGGARGFAHLGALRALYEQGVVSLPP